MIVQSTAPSNIALIKYMGKSPGNKAVNKNLSMTLSAFYSTVEIYPTKETQDIWRPLSGSENLRLSTSDKFITFFRKELLKDNIKEFYEIRSGNNFPSDAGLASSASSFAALTKAIYLLKEKLGLEAKSIKEQALASREGSGSSCRSFFSPWCYWTEEDIGSFSVKIPPLVDFVVLADQEKKKVSSSQAHQNIRTSPLFENRIERANLRYEKMKTALETGDYKKTAELSWDELWDMHSLFHTSSPPFFYFAPETIRILRFVEELWEQTGHGPVTTIDAGPNVHLLVPEEESLSFATLLEKNKFQYIKSKA
ncbi:MAG: diphosphomevalonate decarboxylase [Oligoflexia bacterium]|nr:diphosphomevalonate decarboxylase [Oligoflexia bacterium]